jgi:hypothetical protein
MECATSSRCSNRGVSRRTLGLEALGQPAGRRFAHMIKPRIQQHCNPPSCGKCGSTPKCRVAVKPTGRSSRTCPFSSRRTIAYVPFLELVIAALGEELPLEKPQRCVLHSAVFFSPHSLCFMHTGEPEGVAVSHCITGFSDSANPHYVSDPLPQSFVGSS